MKLSRLAAVAKKEVMHILRDPFTLSLALGLPAILVLFFGFAIDFDFRGIKVSVYDNDLSSQSRRLIQTFASSGYFELTAGLNPAKPADDVQSEKVFAAMVIPEGFGRNVKTGRETHVQILADGSDNQRAGVISGYLAGIQNKIADADSQDIISARYLFNPELNTRWFIVPGLITVVIGLLSILLTALTVAKEWENGSMEMLLSTPVKPAEIIIGKIAPYLVIVLFSITFVYLLARIVFKVPFLGSQILFWFTCSFFILTCLAQGILISVITRQQQKAMQLSIIMGLLPSLLLSGFIFPIESMPVFFHYFTMILPPRWFITIIRSIFLKGSSIIDIAAPMTALIMLGLIVLAAAGAKSKKDLE